jgi:ATP-dependent DNA ligase
VILRATGRFNEAIAEKNRALELDPLSLVSTLTWDRPTFMRASIGTISFPLRQSYGSSRTTLVKEPQSGDKWLHELKFDGYRMLCRIDRGRVTCWSRNGKDWTEKFLNVIAAVKTLKVKSAIIDGGIISAYFNQHLGNLIRTTC